MKHRQTRTSGERQESIRRLGSDFDGRLSKRQTMQQLLQWESNTMETLAKTGAEGR